MIESKTPRMAPVQGYVQGIPWEMHLRAYNVYCSKYGKQEALIEDNCRGGFSTGELDMFIPDWRDELEELPRLRKELLAAQQTILQQAGQIQALREALGQFEKCDLNEGNCASLEIASKRIRDIAKQALSTPAPVAVVPVKDIKKDVDILWTNCRFFNLKWFEDNKHSGAAEVIKNLIQYTNQLEAKLNSYAPQGEKE